MMKSLCMFIASFLPLVKLGENGDYLHRYFVIRTPWISVYLHRFLRSDADKELHNHMWSGLSLILSGAYREEKLCTTVAHAEVVTTLHKAGRFNHIGKDDFHRVDLLSPEVWTLFIVGKKQRDDWGFIDRYTMKYVPWRDFVLARDGFVQEDID